MTSKSILKVACQFADPVRRRGRQGVHLRPQPEDDGQSRQVQQQRHLHQVAPVRCEYDGNMLSRESLKVNGKLIIILLNQFEMIKIQMTAVMKSV